MIYQSVKLKISNYESSSPSSKSPNMINLSRTK